MQQRLTIIDDKTILYLFLCDLRGLGSGEDVLARFLDSDDFQLEVEDCDMTASLCAAFASHLLPSSCWHYTPSREKTQRSQRSLVQYTHWLILYSKKIRRTIYLYVREEKSISERLWKIRAYLHYVSSRAICAREDFSRDKKAHRVRRVRDVILLWLYADIVERISGRHIYFLNGLIPEVLARHTTIASNELAMKENKIIEKRRRQRCSGKLQLSCFFMVCVYTSRGDREGETKKSTGGRPIPSLISVYSSCATHKLYIHMHDSWNASGWRYTY